MLEPLVISTKEAESFIKDYYKEFENADVNVTLKNGIAFVRSEKGQKNLGLEDINDAISSLFESRNMGVELNFTNNVILIKTTQKRSDVKRLEPAA